MSKNKKIIIAIILVIVIIVAIIATICITKNNNETKMRDTLNQYISFINDKKYDGRKNTYINFTVCFSVVNW